MIPMTMLKLTSGDGHEGDLCFFIVGIFCYLFLIS